MKDQDTQKVLDILKATAMHTYLATSESDQPSIRSMTAVIGDDLSIWLCTFTNSRKVDQIIKNPKVCLYFVEQPNGDKSASVTGRALIINDLEEKKKVWSLATYDLNHYFPQGPESKNLCLVKIKPLKIEWRENWESSLHIYKP